MWFFGPDWLTDGNECPVEKSYKKYCLEDSAIMSKILMPGHSIIDKVRSATLGKRVKTTKIVLDLLKKKVKRI